MWTANIKSIVADAIPGMFVMTTTYTDGVTPVDIVDRLSDPTSITKTVTDRLIEFTRIDAVKTLIATPPTGVFTPPAPTPPTTAQTNMSNFMQWNQIIIGLGEAKNLGFITGNEAPVVAAKSKYLAAAAAVLPVLFP